MDINLILIFLTGLTTGGLTCVAVQGGLLASVLSKEEESVRGNLKEDGKIVRLVTFLVAKLAAYTLLGFLLGLVGSTVSLTPSVRGWLQIFIGIYLLGIAGSMLDLHPWFRYFVFTPPRFLTRFIKKESRNEGAMTAAILGGLTVFIPCAITQGIEVVALGTGKPLWGAMIMFSFILGTSPTFLILGFLWSKASKKFRGSFDKLAAGLLVVLAFFSINGGLGVMGSIYTLQNFWKVTSTSTKVGAEPSAEMVGQIQVVTINVISSGYVPQSIKIKKGIKTKLTLVTNQTYGCSRAFTIPSLGIQEILPETGSKTIEFTPTKSGPLVFSCSMGMYTGTFQVI